MDQSQFPVLLRKLDELANEFGVYVPVCIHGQSGIGKTAIAKSFAQAYANEIGEEYRCIVVKVGQADGAGDLVGSPEKITYHPCPLCLELGFAPPERRLEGLVQHAKEKHDVARPELLLKLAAIDHLSARKQGFAVTNIWPTSGRGIIVLDEINRAPADIQNAVLGLVAERYLELNGYAVPPGFIVIATANPGTEEYSGTQHMDRAMRDRMAHFNLIASPEKWLGYARENRHMGVGLMRSTFNFFAKNPKYVGCEQELSNPIIDEKQISCPRQAEELMHLAMVLDESLLFEAARGILGPLHAPAFLEHLRKGEDPVTCAEILANYAGHSARILDFRAKNRNDAIGATINDVLDSLRKRQAELSDPECLNLIAFLKDLDTDNVVHIGKSMTTSEKVASSFLYRHFEKLNTVHAKVFVPVIVNATRKAMKNEA